MEPTEKAAYSIQEWAKRHSVSVPLFYKLQREGRGPRVIHIGRRTPISVEADAQWRKDREAESASVPAVREAV
jgi:predicted DNA-binding transcriptional regulator AlpA